MRSNAIKASLKIYAARYYKFIPTQYSSFI